MSGKTFNISDSQFKKDSKDPNGLETPLTSMRRVHPDLAKTEDGTGIIIHNHQFQDPIVLKGEEYKPLEYLNLADSSCDKISFEGEFPNLKHLDLSKCKLKIIDFGTASFPKLEQLYLRQNKLKVFQLNSFMPKLELLDVGENPFLQEINLASSLPALKYLYFYKKKEEKDDKKLNRPITEFSFDSMSSLKVLDLENGGLKILLDKLLDLKELETLYLTGNAPEGIPEAVLGTGERHNSVQEVLAYLGSDADVYLRHSKLFFIGNGEVGKTSIWRKLIDRKAPLVEKKNRTDTLDTIPFSVEKLQPTETGLEEVIDYHFDIWDFAGQDKYREIQQLFCSPKSLYIYVTSHDDESNEDYIGYEYWLSMVKGYGYDANSKKDSPVIFVVNKIDEKPKFVNEGDIEGIFPNAKKFHKISASTLDGVDGLEKDIRQSIKGISHDVFTDQYDGSWIKIKRILEDHAKKHIFLDEYLDICKDVLREDEAMAWLRILDRIGTVIYFGDHEGLKNWIILKPTWIKDAISGVIDYALEHYGVVREKDLPEIWKDYGKDDQDKFKLLLTKYKMASPPKRNDYDDIIYVIPSALPSQKPKLRKELEAVPNYQVKFEYAPFIPAGTVSKLTVGLFDWIYEQKYYWKKNVVLHHDYKNFALVSEDWGNKTVNVSFYGENPEVLYQLIVTELEKNNKDLEKARLISNLGFEIWAYYDGDWIPKKNVKKFGIGDYQFLLGSERSEMKGMPIHQESHSDRANSISVIGDGNVIVQDSSGSISIAANSSTQSKEDDGTFWIDGKGEINILFIGANPSGTDKLDLDGEYAKINSALTEKNKNVDSKRRASFDELKQGINKYKPIILHISGHGIGNEEEYQALARQFPELGIVEAGIVFFSEDKRQSAILRHRN